jgi:putative tricarboxylic transport membrane protein
MAIDAPDTQRAGLRNPLLRALLRKDSLAGLMFIAIGGTGLWLAQGLTVGTLRRMGAGFMPQVLCWMLMGLGAIVLVQGLLARDKPTLVEEVTSATGEGGGQAQSFWPILIVAASLVSFALTIEPFGLVVAIVSLVLIASFAYRGLGWWETLATAVVMTGLCWAVFVLGLGMSVKVFPEF